MEGLLIALIVCQTSQLQVQPDTAAWQALTENAFEHSFVKGTESLK